METEKIATHEPKSCEQVIREQAEHIDAQNFVLKTLSDLFREHGIAAGAASSAECMTSLRNWLSDAAALHAMMRGERKASELLGEMERLIPAEIFTAIVVDLATFLAPRLQKFVEQLSDAGPDHKAAIVAAMLVTGMKGWEAQRPIFERRMLTVQQLQRKVHELSTIRRAKPTDRRRILGLIRSFSPVDAGHAKRDLDGEIFAAELDGKIIGVTGIQNDDLSERACWLGWTYVEEKHRGQGLGTRLLHHIERLASQRRKALFITTSSHPVYIPAIEFYKSNGYAIAGTLPDFFGPGRHLITLRRGCPDALAEQLRQQTACLDGLADIFREFEVLVTGMTTEELERSLRGQLEDARRFRAEQIAPAFSKAAAS